MNPAPLGMTSVHLDITVLHMDETIAGGHRSRSSTRVKVKLKTEAGVAMMGSVSVDIAVKTGSNAGLSEE